MVKICDIEQKKFDYYRATVGALKKALKDLPDDAPIGVRFDSGYGYTDIYELITSDTWDRGVLYILNCD